MSASDFTARPASFRAVIRFVFTPLLVALSFLTLLPVGVADATDREISRSHTWYPLIGLPYRAMLAGIAVCDPLAL